MLIRSKMRAVMGHVLSDAAESLWWQIAFRLALLEEDAVNANPTVVASAVRVASELFLAVYRSECVAVPDRPLLILHLQDIAPTCHRLWGELSPLTYPRCSLP